MRRKIVSRTALGVTAIRAVETCRPERDRLFEDPFAMGFLPPAYRAAVRLLHVPLHGAALLGPHIPPLGAVLLSLRERHTPGIAGEVACRTRFIDDTLREAAAKGFEQVVILGAGLDSRAYRIAGMDRIPVFEVDHPVTQAWKRKRLQRMSHGGPSHVAFVPIDFERQGLGHVMEEAGFRTGVKSFFIWEGVTQYLGAKTVDSTFHYMSRAGAPGSRVVFTYIHRGLIDDSVPIKDAKKLRVWFKGQREPWVFGIDPAELAPYLAARSFRLIDDVGAADYRRRYLDPMGRRMHLFEGERVAVAETGEAGGKGD